MTTIKSTFSHDAEGWTIQGDVASWGWQKTGGDPGGNLQWTDAATGSDSYWVASSAFTGDKSAFYGGHLSYSIFDTGNNYAGAADVEIVGANGTTLYATVGQPNPTWTDESVKLTKQGGWHTGSLDGPAASAGDIRGVLASVSQLLIRAEYVSGDESGGLDNVKLVSKGSAAVGTDDFAGGAAGAAAPAHGWMSHDDHLF